MKDDIELILNKFVGSNPDLNFNWAVDQLNDLLSEKESTVSSDAYFTDIDGDIMLRGDVASIWIKQYRAGLFGGTNYRVAVKMRSGRGSWYWDYGSEKRAIECRDHLIKELIKDPLNVTNNQPK